jgi:predicted DNA-binding transcriptional regulator YafY
MDIMRHGAGVEVIAPKELRQDVKEQLRLAANQYP